MNVPRKSQSNHLIAQFLCRMSHDHVWKNKILPSRYLSTPITDRWASAIKVLQTQHVLCSCRRVTMVDTVISKEHFRKYSHAPHDDVSINDGLHIRRWSHNIREKKKRKTSKKNYNKVSKHSRFSFESQSQYHTYHCVTAAYNIHFG